MSSSWLPAAALGAIEGIADGVEPIHVQMRHELEQIVGRRLANAYRRQEGKAANGAEAEPTPVETK